MKQVSCLFEFEGNEMNCNFIFFAFVSCYLFCSEFSNACYFPSLPTRGPLTECINKNNACIIFVIAMIYDFNYSALVSKC